MKLQKIRWKILIFVWRMKGATISGNVRIYGKIRIEGDFHNLAIGAESVLNHGVLLNCRDKLTIGEKVHLSSFVQIHTGKLTQTFPRIHNKEAVTISDEVWVASSCIINSGVTLAKRVTVGAGSIVLKSVLKENIFVCGSPAREMNQ
jgi:acetyltransferase-like isoleucine patch superfamily enzyme